MRDSTKKTCDGSRAIGERNVASPPGSAERLPPRPSSILLLLFFRLSLSAVSPLLLHSKTKIKSIVF